MPRWWMVSAALATVPLIAAAEPQQHVVQKVAARPGGTLVVDIPVGGVLDVRSWDAAAVGLTADLRGRDWRGTRVALTSLPDGAKLTATQDRGGGYSTGHHFALTVPSRYSIEVRSGGGDIVLTDMTGRFTGSTGGGMIKLTGLQGEARLTTGGGAVVVSDSILDGRVSTGGGDVTFRNVRGSLDGRTGGGRITRDGTLAGSARHAARRDDSGTDISKAGGGIEIDRVTPGAELSTGGGAVHVGRADGAIEVSTGGGDIRIDSAGGDVSATTGAGDVFVGLDGGHAVDIRSGSGRVDIVVPRGVRASFDLELGYTQRHGPARIVSDMPLSISETAGFEASRGSTPQRFVHAVGGTGGPRIVVRTTNGDIRVRYGNAR